MLALLLLSAICARSLSEWCPCLHSQPRFPLNLPLLSTRGGTDVIHIARCNNNFQCFAARINHLVNLASRSFPTDVNGMAIFAATCCSTRYMLQHLLHADVSVCVRLDAAAVPLPIPCLASADNLLRRIGQKRAKNRCKPYAARL